jgi:hypothetical protein
MSDFHPPQALEKAKEIGLGNEFISWLSDNWMLWGEFVSLCMQIRAKGRKHWSADAVCHVLRFHRVVRDHVDPTFKINNNRTSQLARLYNACAGEVFFELRRRHRESEPLAGRMTKAQQ